MTAALGRWVLRHRTIRDLLHRIHHRGGRYQHYAAASACVMCRAVWAAMLAEPGTRERLYKGITDHAAGRWYRYDTKTGKSTPNPDWPKDGPQPGDRA